MLANHDNYSHQEESRKDSNSMVLSSAEVLSISTIFLVEVGAMDSAIASLKAPVIPVSVSLVGLRQYLWLKS